MTGGDTLGGNANWMLSGLDEWIEARLPAGARVLEIGPGPLPRRFATDFVDVVAWEGAAFGDRPLTLLDAQHEALPFADGSFDFVYSRHVIEDLARPGLLLSEMQRVGRAGYIETPSPLTECTRGVDDGPWRGYRHHRWLVWAAGGRLRLLPKLDAIDGLALDIPTGDLLRSCPHLSNSHFAWQGDFSIDVLGADDGDRLAYAAALRRAIGEGVTATIAFVSALYEGAGTDGA